MSRSYALSVAARAVPWLDRVRAGLSGCGYALAALAVLAVVWQLNDLLGVSAGSFSKIAWDGVANIWQTIWVRLPAVLLLVAGVNRAPRAGARRVTWLAGLALLMTLVTQVMSDPGFHSREWVIHRLGTLYYMALAVVLYAYFRDARSGAERLVSARIERVARDAELQRAQLQLLHAQVEPHFLFNTLSAVRSLARLDPHATAVMLDNLVRYFSTALPRLRLDHAALQDEMSLVEAYLSIYRVRMGARLGFEVTLPAALADLPVPTMMLLTLVENALKHGIGREIEGGFIRVSARRDGQLLKLCVTDTGPGLRVRQGSGMGLANVRLRLLVLYGDAAQLLLAPVEPRGLLATIAIPVEWPA